MDFTIHFKLFSIKRTLTISQKWLQFAIVVFVMLASTILAFWGSPTLFVVKSPSRHNMEQGKRS